MWQKDQVGLLHGQKEFHRKYITGLICYGHDLWAIQEGYKDNAMIIFCARINIINIDKLCISYLISNENSKPFARILHSDFFTFWNEMTWQDMISFCFLDATKAGWASFLYQICWWVIINLWMDTSLLNPLEKGIVQPKYCEEGAKK